MRSFSLLAAGLVALGLSSPASAAIYNVVGSFSGGQLGLVEFDVTINNDFGADIFDTNTGLTINSLSSSVVAAPFVPDGGLGYTYVAGIDYLSFGGFSGSVTGLYEDATDFRVDILDFTGIGPDIFFYSVIDSLDKQLGYGQASIDALNIIELPIVPLPPGLPLVLTGLAGLAGLRLRKCRITQA